MSVVTGQLAIDLAMRLPEYSSPTNVGDVPASILHQILLQLRLPNGVGSGKQGAVYFGRHTLSGNLDLDLVGGTLKSLADPSVGVEFPLVTTICVVNRSTTNGELVNIGAGSNPFISWLLATGDGIKVGVGGFFLLHAPQQGYATAAGTADILRLAPAAGSPIVDVFIAGRAS